MRKVGSKEIFGSFVQSFANDGHVSLVGSHFPLLVYQTESRENAPAIFALLPRTPLKGVHNRPRRSLGWAVLERHRTLGTLIFEAGM